MLEADRSSVVRRTSDRCSVARSAAAGFRPDQRRHGVQRVEEKMRVHPRLQRGELRLPRLGARRRGGARLRPGVRVERARGPHHRRGCPPEQPEEDGRDDRDKRHRRPQERPHHHERRRGRQQRGGRKRDGRQGQEHAPEGVRVVTRAAGRPGLFRARVQQRRQAEEHAAGAAAQRAQELRDGSRTASGRAVEYLACHHNHPPHERNRARSAHLWRRAFQRFTKNVREGGRGVGHAGKIARARGRFNSGVSAGARFVPSEMEPASPPERVLRIPKRELDRL